MPAYSFICENCQTKFEIICSIAEYSDKQKCVSCNSKKTVRLYTEDLSTLNTSVKKSDSELRTIGDIANRNRDKMSDDQKAYLQQKHNAYKEEAPTKSLPQGMSRIAKPKTKIKWRPQ